MTPELTDAQIGAIYKATFEGMPGCVRSAPSSIPPTVIAFARALIAALPQQAAQAIPEGWKPMPPEASAAMLEAWKVELCVPIGSTPEAKARRAYRAMLHSAPLPPAPEGEAK